MPPSSSAPSHPPLNLIIRFTASIPDLSLTIPSPRTTTPTTLSTLIRPHLPQAFAASPLRLIYSGALLPPYMPISTSLRLSSTGKSPAQLYIHCSLSTETQLSPAELDKEAKVATSLQLNTQAHEDTGQYNKSTAVERDVQPAPQGFDRLLSAGLSTAEVASLRSQFLAVQAHTHTPDTMPSPAEMRILEERWLDSGTSLNGGTGGAEAGADDETGGMLEDMLWGNIMGFFWALGAIVWLVREEGVWSKRRQVGVVTGVIVNVIFCILRIGI